MCTGRQVGQLKKKKKKKQAMGLGESFTFLAKSPYIRDLATLVRPAGTASTHNQAAFTQSILAVLAAVPARRRGGLPRCSWSTLPGAERVGERSAQMEGLMFSV